MKAVQKRLNFFNLGYETTSIKGPAVSANPGQLEEKSKQADRYQRLLDHVVRGENDAVRVLPTQDISLLSKKSRVIDLSGRVFEDISPFEYALWALDSHMWNSMLACIPENEQGNKLLGELRSQYEVLHTKGVTYKLNGEVLTEPHFSFQNTIIKALQTQLDLSKAPQSEKKWDSVKKQWIEGVGFAQRLLPAHVVHEYCSTSPFKPILNFNNNPGSSKKYHAFVTTRDTYATETWFSNKSKIGATVAIGKGNTPYCYESALGAANASDWIKADLAAMKTLCNVRTNDFNNLAKLLGVTIHVAAPEEKEIPQSALIVDSEAEVDDLGYGSSSPFWSPGPSFGGYYSD